jgi:HK97 family phage prohead protease
MTTRRMVKGGGREGRIFTASLALSEVDTTAGFTMMEGRACPYGVFTTRWWFQESFAAGLFDKSIKEAAAALPLLIFHDDMTWPIGHASEWRSEADGLYGVWKLDSSTEAQRAARMAQEGHLPYLSVGYQPILSDWELTELDNWDPDDVATLDKVTRREARLVETSVVATPAFKDAEIQLVRSTEQTTRARRHADPHPKLTGWRNWRSTIES